MSGLPPATVVAPIHDPHPVLVHVCGTTLTGKGRLVHGGDAGRSAAEQIYRQRYPKAALSTHDPMLLIDPA